MGDEQERKLFVRGLNRNTSEEALKHYFEEYGRIVDCNIMRDQEKRSRGFGFILYEDVEAIDKIIVAKKEGGHFVLDEQTIEVKRALPKTPRGASGLPRSDIINRKVFVGGLPSTISEQDVRDYFETFGRINEIQLIKDRETGRPRGFAFLTFDEEDSADKCLQRRTHEICRKMCEVKRAQAKTREERNNSNNMDSEQGSSRQALPSDSSKNNSAGGMPPSEVNKLIQQAFAMGQGMVHQPSVHQPLATETPSTTSILLQALAGHHSVPQVPPPQPPPPTTTQPQTNISQLAQLLQSGGLDASVLGSLLKVPQQQAPAVMPQVVPQVPVTSMEVYNPPSQPTYQSLSPTQKSGKEEVANTRANRVYRPY